MKYKLILIFIFGIFLISFISAQDLEISIKPHYYKDGVEILPTSGLQFTDISFEIIGTNHNSKSKILNLSIVDSYPLVFKDSLPKNIKEDLRILQTKTLFIGQIIDIKNLEQFNQTNINFWVGIEGILEKTGEVLYIESHSSIFVPKQKKEEREIGIFENIGNLVWEGSPYKGLLVIVVVVFLIGFFIWKYNGSAKLRKWKERSERKRQEKRQYDEGY